MNALDILFRCGRFNLSKDRKLQEVFPQFLLARRGHYCR